MIWRRLSFLLAPPVTWILSIDGIVYGLFGDGYLEGVSATSDYGASGLFEPEVVETTGENEELRLIIGPQ